MLCRCSELSDAPRRRGLSPGTVKLVVSSLQGLPLVAGQSWFIIQLLLKAYSLS